MPPRGKGRGSKTSVNGDSKASAKKPRATKAYKIPPPLPNGEVVTDVKKKPWRIGAGIGQGGFGLIYLASDDPSHQVGPNAEYVMKVEPVTNGPLFCELHFYQRAAKPDKIDDFMKSRKLQYLGVPKYITTGQHSCNGMVYRFLVMQRFGSDLQKIFEKSGKCFSKKTVLCLGLRLLDALEYMHNNEYVHADIKASNILLGCRRGLVNPNEVYLVDFGLAYRYMVEGKHKEYKEDPKRVHDGTIEFTSRDSHRGVVPSRRSDLEILGYCLLQWLCSRLPWEDNLANKDYVRDCKIRYMDNVDSLMRACFPAGDEPTEIKQYLKYVSKLEYEEKPDYNKLRKFLQTSLKKSSEWTLDLNTDVAQKEPPQQKRAKKRKSSEALDSSRAKMVRSPEQVQETLTPAMRERLAIMEARASTSSAVKSRSSSAQSFSAGSLAARSPSSNSVAGRRTKKSAVTVHKNGEEADEPTKVCKTSSSTGRRRVKRSKAETTDMAVQTSPALRRTRQR